MRTPSALGIDSAVRDYRNSKLTVPEDQMDSSAVRFTENAKQFTKTMAKSASGVGWGTALTGTGLLMGIVSGAGAMFFEGTLDKISKVALVLSVLVGGAGVAKLVGVGKKLKNSDEGILPLANISVDTLAKEGSQYFGEQLAISCSNIRDRMNFNRVEDFAYHSSEDKVLRSRVFKLSAKYAEILDHPDVKSIIRSLKPVDSDGQGANSQLPGIAMSSGDTFSLEEFKQDFSILVAYMSMARTMQDRTTDYPVDVYDLTAEDEFVRLLSVLKISTDLSDPKWGTLSSEYVTTERFPKEFVALFHSSQLYNKYLLGDEPIKAHLNDPVSVEGTDYTPEMIKGVLDEFRISAVNENQAAEDYLARLEGLRNSMSAIQSAYDYIETNEGSDNTEVQREVSLLKAGLIAGLGLQSANLDYAGGFTLRNEIYGYRDQPDRKLSMSDKIKLIDDKLTELNQAAFTVSPSRISDIVSGQVDIGIDFSAASSAAA